MKVLLLSDDIRVLDIIKNYDGLASKGIRLLPERGNLINASQRIATEMPDVVMLEVSGADSKEFELVEHFKTVYKNMAFMMLSADTSSELLLKAIRVGFSEVIPLPLNEQTITHALTRHFAKQVTTVDHQSKVLSFISCKGGSGTTFVATNFAYAMATLFNKKVLLIDANQYFGDAAMYVSDQKPPMTLADLCNQINRLDIAFLQSSLINLTSNFSILAAAENPASAADVHTEHIDTIVRIARNYYDYIVFDLGRQIDAITVKCLDLSDSIYLVLQMVLPYIRDAKHLVEVFRSLGYPSSKVQLIVNRYEKSGSIKLSDLTNAIQTQAVHTIPNDYKIVTDCINQGVSIQQVLPNHLVAKSIAALGEALTGEKVKEAGFMSKFFAKK